MTSLPGEILKFLLIIVYINFSNHSFSYDVTPEDTENLICSFNMVHSIYYDVNYQLQMNDLVREISNRTRLILKKWKFPQISCFTFQVKHFLFDISINHSDFHGKDPLNLT